MKSINYKELNHTHYKGAQSYFSIHFWPVKPGCSLHVSKMLFFRIATKSHLKVIKLLIVSPLLFIALSVLLIIFPILVIFLLRNFLAETLVFSFFLHLFSSSFSDFSNKVA